MRWSSVQCFWSNRLIGFIVSTNTKLRKGRKRLTTLKQPADRARYYFDIWKFRVDSTLSKPMGKANPRSVEPPQPAPTTEMDSTVRCLLIKWDRQSGLDRVTVVGQDPVTVSVVFSAEPNYSLSGSWLSRASQLLLQQGDRIQYANQRFCFATLPVIGTKGGTLLVQESSVWLSPTLV